MAWLGLSMATNFLSVRYCVSRLRPLPKTHRSKWRYICTSKTPSSDFSFPKALEDVTVVDSKHGAVRAVQTLLELPLDRHVSWNTQLYKPASKATQARGPVLSISACAGDDVDFGNGPHLFVPASGSSDDAEIWKLMRRYFETEECRKVWFNYSPSMRTLALMGVRPTGFCGDIRHMGLLHGDRVKTTNIDSISKTLLAKGDRDKLCYLWQKNNLPDDQANIRIWELNGEVDNVHITPEWIVRACCDASITHRLYDRLWKLLQKVAVQGDAYQAPSGASAMDRNEDVFNLLQAYQLFFHPLVEALHAIEVEGLSMDFKLLEREVVEEDGKKQVLEDKFRQWASTFSKDALYMDMTSSQLRQVLFAPCTNIHNKTVSLPTERAFKISRAKSDEILEKTGRTVKEIVLKGAGIKAVSHTKQGWPSTSVTALRELMNSYGSKSSRRIPPGSADALQHLLTSIETGRLVQSFKNLSSAVGDEGRFRLKYQANFYSGHLENTSRGKEWEAGLRRSITPSPGNDLISIMYPALQMWTMAQLSGCPSLHGRLSSKLDATSLLACELFLRSQEDEPTRQSLELSHQQYSTALRLDVAMRKGGDASTVQKFVHCTKEEALHFMKMWYELHPAVEEWRKGREELIKQRGFAETYMGRRRKLKSGRIVEGIGFIVNGTAAEIVMGGLLRLRQDERVRALRWRAVYADRDEIILEGPSWSAESVTEIIEDDVYRPTGFELSVPPRVIVRHLTKGQHQYETAALNMERVKD